MAIDTEIKRKSVASVGKFFRPRAIVPDGTIIAADRQHIGWGYAGIAAGAPGVAVAQVFLTLPDRDTALTVSDEHEAEINLTEQ